MRFLHATILALIVFALPAVAQQSTPALLVADSISIESDNRLVAEGNVEALHDGVRLTASRIIYDRSTDSLMIDGPVRIVDGEGNVTVADHASLDASLENGLLQGARVVLGQQLQMASVEARRVNGRYTQLSKVAITSCQVCGQDQTPLWQIRAKRVVHDQEARQIYLDGAQLRVMDVPVFYFPQLRLPDPTLKRARGFLIPELRSSTLLGFGLKAPYFFPLGAHKDLTLTPYLSPVTKTVEARYRQAFVKGEIEVNGAISRDTLVPDTNRGYLFANGTFDLQRDFKLTFDIEATTDRAYLSDYDYSDKDRLDSSLTFSRVRRDEFISAGVIHFESLRDGEDNATLPTIVADAQYERRLFPSSIGGEVRLGVATHGHLRYSNADEVGRDLGRINTEFSYLNQWTLPGGFRLGVTGTLWGDHFRVYQDSTDTRTTSQITPGVSVDLRYPLLKTSQSGARILLEPLLQVGWVGGDRPNIENDESTRVEFDEGNLLSLSRFPEADRRERGAIGAMGLRWLRQAPQGWTAGLTLGTVFRGSNDVSFNPSSGLQGDISDFLIAAHLKTANGIGLMARGVLDQNLEFSKAEIIGGWDYRNFDIEATYVLLVSDPAAGRATPISEWTLDGSYDFSENWTASTNWRYDLVGNRIDRAGIGLDYSNECIDVGFSASRRFASSTNVEPSTNYGLTVALKGFSTGGSAKEYSRTCS